MRDYFHASAALSFEEGTWGRVSPRTGLSLAKIKSLGRIELLSFSMFT
jgi:hypothetical protein